MTAASTTQTKTPMGDTEYADWLKDEMKLGDAAIDGIKIVGGLTKLSMWANKDDKTFNSLKLDLLKGIGSMTPAVGIKTDANYKPPVYMPGAPICISSEAMHCMHWGF